MTDESKDLKDKSPEIQFDDNQGVENSAKKTDSLHDNSQNTQVDADKSMESGDDDAKPTTIPLAEKDRNKGTIKSLKDETQPKSDHDQSTDDNQDEDGGIDSKPDTKPNLAADDNIQFDQDSKPDTYASRSKLLTDENGALSFLTFRNNSKDETEPPDRETAVLSRNSPRWQKIIDQQSKGGTTSLGEQREVLFVIRGMIERVVMKENSEVTLGRFDTGTQPNQEIDLNPYGAMDRGVSRHHCKILLQDNQIYIIDLESTNGTFLAGNRLEPNTPTLVRKGDELLLGRLSIQVLFR